MKLYHVPQSRSVRPRWLLEEIGVPYEVVLRSTADGSLKTPEYLKLNPNGAVPTLVDGDTVVYESAAICLHLADKFPDAGLAPAPGTADRAHYYQWVLYTMATLEPPLLDIFLQTVRLPEAERSAAVLENGRRRFAEVAAILTEAVRGRQYLVGDRFSTADIMIASTLHWAALLGLLEPHPVLLEYTQRMVQRPAFERAQS